MTREEELDWLYRLRSEIYVCMPKEWLNPMNNALNMAIKDVEQQPSEGKVSMEVYKQVTAERDIAIEQLKELGYEFGEKIRTSEDCVSRQMVKEGMIKYGFRAPDMTVIEFTEDDLPPVTPKLPTSDDCVSRQAVIEIIKKSDACLYEKSDNNILVEKIKTLPPITTQSWIPVSERLPKESDGVVLISVDLEVKTGRYSEFSNTWYKGDMRGVGGDDPIAWQPLPQPYEEKSGSEE